MPQSYAIHTPVPPIDRSLEHSLWASVHSKTKPQGALGKLEALAVQIACIQGKSKPLLMHPSVLVFAADHGITEEGVSPYPQAVTAQMVLNFIAGGAAINVFAKQMGFSLSIVDSGVNAELPFHPDLEQRKIGYGTANFLHSPAMTERQCLKALEAGHEVVQSRVKAGTNVFAFGEMGIGNTSSASCLMSVLCDIPIHACTGRGTGLDDTGLKRKQAILQQALQTHAVNAADTLQVLYTFGGFEIAMLAGAMLEAARHRAVLLIDGFIASAALLVASRWQPNVLQYCVFSHCSEELGHRRMLEALGVSPLLNIGLRLGEGTGAVLAYPMVQAAVNFLNEMASFEQAGVSTHDG